MGSRMFLCSVLLAQQSISYKTTLFINSRWHRFSLLTQLDILTDPKHITTQRQAP
jgi:hypothetical protein